MAAAMQLGGRAHGPPWTAMQLGGLAHGPPWAAMQLSGRARPKTSFFFTWLVENIGSVFGGGNAAAIEDAPTPEASRDDADE